MKIDRVPPFTSFRVAMQGLSTDAHTRADAREKNHKHQLCTQTQVHLKPLLLVVRFEVKVIGLFHGLPV